MHTEINGDWIGYVKRFSLPTAKVLKYPLKHIGILFCAQIVVSAFFTFLPIPPLAKFIPILAVMMFAVYYYLKIHWQTFWNVVLEESKGFIPDLLMWLYYVIICIFSISPSFLALFFILK